MAFMQQSIEFGGYFQVDTTRGLEIVPEYVIGRSMSIHVEALLNYLEGTPLDPDKLIEHKTGYLARMSAPGYLDCTDWTVFDTEGEAKAYLTEHYSDESEETSEFAIIVGNIGTVYTGTNEEEADAVFESYKEHSATNYGRAAGEDVTMMKDGEPYREFAGSNKEDE